MTYVAHQESLKFSSVEFKAFRDFLQEFAGIDLGDNKQYLVASRVRRILTDHKCASLHDLTDMIKRPSQSLHLPHPKQILPAQSRLYSR